MRGAVFLSVLTALGTGCSRKQSPEPAPGPSASGAATSQAPSVPRCSVGSASFTIGERPPVIPEDGGDEILQPFAVEVGGAVARADGFAVAALRSEKNGVAAVVALIDDDGRGKLVELGRTFGDAEPPRLAASGDRVIAAVPDNDAAGGTLRLASIGNGKVTWGAEVEQGRDESAVFDVELGKERGLLVWDELEKKPVQGVIRAISFAIGDLGNATRPRTLSPEGDDAEAPELARRPGGFWVAWIGRQPPEAKPKAAPARKPSKTAPNEDPPPPDDPVVDLGRRWLRIAPLDENGALAGEPKDVTGRQAHVMVFDLAPLPDGGALLAWRDDAASPGVEGGAVHLARVAPSGSIDRLAIEDEKIGGGTPSLLADTEKGAAPPLWLSLGSVTDVTRLTALDASGKALDGLDADAALGTAEPLALRAGRLLVARPRALAMELSVARCKPGRPSDAGAAEPGELF